jgi:hypothetical protein
VFELAALRQERTITSGFVEEAASEMVQGNEHFFTLWDYAKSHRRRLIIAVCDRFANGPDPVNLDLISVKLEEYGVLARDRDLADDITELQELEILYFDGSYRGGTYRVAIPLMGMWIRVTQDFQALVARARQEALEMRA